jgi:hypothetical protein
MMTLGIATYSQAGAQFGFNLLWTVFLTTPFMIAIQLVARTLAVPERIAANAKEHHHTSYCVHFGPCRSRKIFNIAAILLQWGSSLPGCRRIKT